MKCTSLVTVLFLPDMAVREVSTEVIEAIRLVYERYTVMAPFLASGSAPLNHSRDS